MLLRNRPVFNYNNKAHIHTYGAIQIQILRETKTIIKMAFNFEERDKSDIHII